MDIHTIVSLNRTKCAVQCNSKKRILEIISELAANENSSLEEAEVLASLMQRERMGSTGIGNGIALPHGRLAGLEAVIAIVVVTSAPGINFDAIDNKPVDIFFALLVPEEQTEGHLQTLAMIASKLNDKETVKAIRKAETSNDILAALD